MGYENFSYGWRTIFCNFLFFFHHLAESSSYFLFFSSPILIFDCADCIFFLSILLLVERISFCSCSFPSYTMVLAIRRLLRSLSISDSTSESVFFLWLSLTSTDSTQSIFCCFSFFTINFAVFDKYLTGAFLMELISLIVHENFITPPALINSHLKSRSETMNFFSLRTHGFTKAAY